KPPDAPLPVARRDDLAFGDLFRLFGGNWIEAVSEGNLGHAGLFFYVDHDLRQSRRVGLLCFTQAARKNFSDDYQRVVSERVFEGEYTHIIVSGVSGRFEFNGDAGAQFLRESFYFFFYVQAVWRVAGNLKRLLNLPPFITRALDQALYCRQAPRERP